MHNEILEKYINDPNILYIYEIGLQIYGLFEGVEDRDFLIVVSDDYEIPIEITENENIRVFYISDWFNEVMNNTMLAWICACLPKKYVIKEYVKLLLKVDPLKLRKYFDETYNFSIAYAKTQILNDAPITGQKQLWEIIKYLKFANQIIENHKIVNFKEVSEDYKLIVSQTSDLNLIFNTFETLIHPHLERFKKYTDGILIKSKLKCIK